ncbi:GGDEF domain-containing protein [Colwellia sp. BRX10-3]|uniref:GGDEF domain-containing protein n=1 Tax=Colwellia sp. BRX10-3 TaxID=2759844 RepID=UPI0015F6B37F|nr:GGDEF domain-containing protein [Colwellia sp. BRX10-3]MBA6390594.1 GGDEF domain-containing protein [Colwellia sp. BRX10-3]
MQTNKLEYCNKYALDVLGLDSNKTTEYSLFDIISKASSIFFESYILPTIVSSGSCQEIQISLMLNPNEKVAAVANVKLVESKIFWSIYLAVARDKLYQELLDARGDLENKTEELTLLSRIDPLTRLLNRRAAIDDFTKIFNLLHRNFVPVSLALIDIDWFKKINDTYGHGRGDEILIELSSILKKVTRTSDIVARWGGEEFLVILYNSNLENTRIFSERLHREINSIKLAGDNKLSISVGVTALKIDNLTCSNVIEKSVKEADIALYEAKDNGRNRTEFFDDINSN